MSNKNPYEVRLDILKMAQEMMDKELDLERDKYIQAIAVNQELKNTAAVVAVMKSPPMMYTPR